MWGIIHGLYRWIYFFLALFGFIALIFMFMICRGENCNGIETFEIDEDEDDDDDIINDKEEE